MPWSKLTKDPGNNMTAAEVLRSTEAGLASNGDAIASFGFSSATYWFSVVLDNPGATPLKRLLVFEPSWLDDIQLTLIQADGRQQQFHGGDYLPFAQRALPNRYINFELTLPPGQSLLLVRTQTTDPFQIGMTLWERSAFFRADGKELLYLGLIYGCIGAMLLYNLMLYFSIREKAYLAYVAYLAAFLLMNNATNGTLFALLWPDSPSWGNWAHSVFIYAILLTGLAFSITFLDLRTKMPGLYRWSVWLFGGIAVSFFITALFGYGVHVFSSILWVSIYTPFVLTLGALSLLAGNQAARYFLPATAAGFIGSLVTALTVLGYVPYSVYGFRAVEVGMLIDAVLLSMALADRLRLARADAEAARSKLIETTHTYAQQLEETVAKRTVELRQANATKDKFFSIVAHDLRGPIGSLSVLFSDVVTTPEEVTDEFLNLARTTTRSTSIFLEELLTWARSQRGEIECTPEAVDIQAALLETQALFATQAQAKGVHLDLAVAEGCWIYADPIMLRTILRNLTHNALKFTGVNGFVRANITREGDRCMVSIIDNGVGMSEEMMANIFRLDVKIHSSRGTSNESGTGLGLVLCKEFVQKNDGEIGVHSQLGKGSVFWFSLPMASADKITDPLVVLERVRELKILVVEDDPLHREATAKVLRDLGCAPFFAFDGDDAISKASDIDFDLILMDIDIPRINGIEATRCIRRNGSAGKIVSLSSYTRQELNRLSGDVCFDGVLDKPLGRDALLGIVAALFVKA